MSLTFSNANNLSLPCVSQVAKWTGDFFNHGIYDIHIHLRGVPLLEWETEVEMDKYAILCIVYCPLLYGGLRRLIALTLGDIEALM